jgi:hypothetical protein
LKIIKYNLSTVFLGIIIFLSLAFFNGCAGLDQFEKQVPPEPAIINNALPFVDVPVPNGFNRDQSKSFVYETGNNDMKVGRLFFNGNSGLKPTVEFYQNEMVNKGWALVNSMASTDTILNYRKEGWICTVIIRPRSFNRSIVEIQIGPVQMQSK